MEISNLQELVDDLRRQISQKEKNIRELTEKLQHVVKKVPRNKIILNPLLFQISEMIVFQENHYKELYTNECNSHEKTREHLQEVTSDLERKVEELGRLRQVHDERMSRLKEEVRI